MMTTTKEDILKRLEVEVAGGKRFTQRATERANEGRMTTAWELFDIAKCACECARQAHDDLWEVTKGELNSEEFELFCESESLWVLLDKAHEAIKAGMKR